ncbi:uncharacterized protein LOC120426931 [Culex pipiens pallens]|uniref:uncharacterized protein LOC120426931 n=1 Tax=Culex pipiens pallens TaxID=42434 RepID=UPI0019538A88|nr:uncharacterized protein LOC120426931 [Culex pipiens pallens]
MMAEAPEVNLTMLSLESMGHPFHFEFWKLKYDNDADWSTQKLWWGVAPTTLALAEPRKRTYQTALLQSQNYHLTLSCEQHRKPLPVSPPKMTTSRFCLAVCLTVAVVLALVSGAQSESSKALPTLNGIKGMRVASDLADNPATRLAAAIAAAKAAKDPAALMNVLYLCANVLSVLIYNPPNYLLFDQLDSFFYISELLPQEYQLNYVKRM